MSNLQASTIDELMDEITRIYIVPPIANVTLVAFAPPSIGFVAQAYFKCSQQVFSSTQSTAIGALRRLRDMIVESSCPHCGRKYTGRKEG